MKGETLFLPTSSSSPPPSPQKKLPPFYPVVHPNTRVVTMTQPAVGHLVPLDKQQREDTSIPRITLLEGRNCIARKTTAALNDRRLSRNKHLSLTASSADASATLVVEGMNPIVVYSGKTRLSLKSKETSKLGHGDVLELVPGHFRYKFEVLSGGDENGNVGVFDNRKRGSNDGGKAVELEESSRKRPRQANSKAEVEGSSFETDPEEGIRHFGVPNDKLAQTFQLLNVQGLPQSATTSCVSIQDVIQGDILVAILSNYMVDLDWLIPACPLIAKVPHVLVIHGEGGRTLNYMKRKKPANWILHKPPFPISPGTQHSKAMLLVYPRGVRIIVHTANLIHVDWNNKSQGLWMQDFPWKDQNNPSKGCGFENDLIDYLSTLKWPEFSVNLPDLGSFNINPSFFKKFDYSNAAVKLDLIQKELWEKTNVEIVEMRKESKRRR